MVSTLCIASTNETSPLPPRNASYATVSRSSLKLSCLHPLGLNSRTESTCDNVDIMRFSIASSLVFLTSVASAALSWSFKDGSVIVSSKRGQDVTAK